MGVLPEPNSLLGPRANREAVGEVRILVAEDSEIGLELTCMMARRLGLSVDGAADGYEALRMVRDAHEQGRPYALVLMDFMMPVIDGIEATRRLRRYGMTAEQLPIIALTAVAEPCEIGRFTAAGGQGYLSKPLSLENLSAVLDAWLPGEFPIALPEQVGQSRTLHSRYAERKRATIARIDSVIANQEADAAIVEEIRDLLHKLAGTAGMFGDEALSVAAADCEQDLIEAGIARSLGVLSRHRIRLGEAA